MTIITTIIENQIIKLPKNLSDLWKGKNVLIRASEDTIIIKKIQTTKLAEIEDKLKGAGKEITKTDLKKAIRWARKT